MIYIIYFLIIFLFSYLYYNLLHTGKYSIRLINYYSIKRFTFPHISSSCIEDLKIICKESVGIIPTNPIFKNQNLDNKIVMIVYHHSQPVAFNIMFDYIFQNKSCLHLGLVLVDKKYQRKGLQKLITWNSIIYILERCFQRVFFSDLGSSATGLKLFNENIPDSYPYLLTHRSKPTVFQKKLALYFFQQFKADTSVSLYSNFEEDRFILRGSNKKEGNGANYLLEHQTTRVSKSPIYNEFFKQLRPEDEVLVIGSQNIFSYIIYNMYSFINRVFTGKSISG